MVSTLTYQALIYLSTGRSPKRLGTRHPSIVPYECFQAKDGFVNIAVTNQKQWEHFFKVIGLPELATDTRFDSMKARLGHYDELRPIIERIISKMTRAETIALMDGVGIPAGPINSVAEILEDSHIQAREMIVELTHPEYGPFRTLGIPIKLSDTPGTVGNAPPRFGEHNREVLAKLGYMEDEIRALGEAGVISSV
jgi:crotonobetainyl-CoA:carnitine CoA-transferase CaiB-like acyl-CoA transferase